MRTRVAAITRNVTTMVLAEAFGNWADARRQIGMLCLGDLANLVVVEFKRGNSGQMVQQALCYAAVISTMRFDC